MEVLYQLAADSPCTFPSIRTCKSCVLFIPVDYCWYRPRRSKPTPSSSLHPKDVAGDHFKVFIMSRALLPKSHAPQDCVVYVSSFYIELLTPVPFLGVPVSRFSTTYFLLLFLPYLTTMYLLRSTTHPVWLSNPLLRSTSHSFSWYFIFLQPFVWPRKELFVQPRTQ